MLAFCNLRNQALRGPLGLELAAAAPERVLSLTLLNALVQPHTFRRPWMMQPFAWRVVDRLWAPHPRLQLISMATRRTGDFAAPR